MERAIAVHKQNSNLAISVLAEAQERGLGVIRNTTGKANFDGYHRYIIFTPGSDKQVTIRSKHCILYEEVRYAKFGKPSIIGEKTALEALLEGLRNN
jgi:hypothetical protein